MNLFMQVAGWTVIHFLWQGAGIALVAAAALRMVAHRTPNSRYVIACAGLALMLAAPIVTGRLLWTAAASRDAAGEHILQPYQSGATARDVPSFKAFAAITAPAAASARSILSGVSEDAVIRGIATAWLTGVFLLLARMAGGWWYVRRLHRIALATGSCRWQTACRRIAYRLGLPAAAHVVESHLVDVPTVVGWLRPAIILPVAAVAALTPAQVEAILAHELAHIRRHDYAVNLLQTIAETLLFYHPAVWWLSRRIRAEREHCCDEIAVRMSGDAVAYARALAALESARAGSLAIALAATGGSLLDRVRRILRAPVTEEPRSPGWAATLALTMIFTAGAGTIQYVPAAKNADVAQPPAPEAPAPHGVPAVPTVPVIPALPPLPPARPENIEPAIAPVPPAAAAPAVPSVPAIASVPATADVDFAQPPPPPLPPVPAQASPAPPAPPAPPALPARRHHRLRLRRWQAASTRRSPRATATGRCSGRTTTNGSMRARTGRSRSPTT